jgi:hypothetical protein
MEIPAGLSPLRRRQIACVLGLAVEKTVGTRARRVLVSLGALADRTKVDQFSHLAPPTVFQFSGDWSSSSLLDGITANYADCLAEVGVPPWGPTAPQDFVKTIVGEFSGKSENLDTTNKNLPVTNCHYG